MDLTDAQWAIIEPLIAEPRRPCPAALQILDQEPRHVTTNRPHVGCRSGLQLSDLALGELGRYAQPAIQGRCFGRDLTYFRFAFRAATGGFYRNRVGPPSQPASLPVAWTSKPPEMSWGTRT